MEGTDTVAVGVMPVMGLGIVDAKLDSLFGPLVRQFFQGIAAKGRGVHDVVIGYRRAIQADLKKPITSHFRSILNV
jgi:hypothetical protein